MSTPTLGFSVDSGNLPGAVADLDKLVSVAGTAEQATAKMADTINQKLGSLAPKLAQTVKSVESLAQRIDQAMNVKWSGAFMGDAAMSASNFGTEIDRLRSKFVPLYAEGVKYRNVVNEIRQAHAAGVLSHREMTAAIEAERQATGRLVAARRQAMSDPSGGAGGTPGAGGGQTRNGMQAMLASNLMFQGQDVLITSMMGMNPAMIGLQQGTQIGGAMMAAGGGRAGVAGLLGAVAQMASLTNVIAIGSTIAAAAAIQWFTSSAEKAKTLDDVLKEHNRTIELSAQLYGKVAEAQKGMTSGGASFINSSIRSDMAALRAMMREEGAAATREFRGEGWLAALGLASSSPALDEMQNLGSGQRPFQKAVDDLISSMRAGKTDLETFNQTVEEIFNRMAGSSENPAALRSLADGVKVLGETLATVDSKFAPFQDPINKLIVELKEGNVDVKSFNAEVEKIGNATGLTKLADEAIKLAASLVQVADAMNEITRAREAATERISRHLREERYSDATVESYEKEVQRQRDLEDRMFAAEKQRMAARTNAERIAAAGAEVGARMTVLGPERDRAISQAMERERLQLELQSIDAMRERARAADENMRQQQLEIGLIGKTAGEVAALQYEFQALAALRAETARTGVAASEAEIEAIRRQAAEVGKLAEMQARLNLMKQVQFERDQMFRSSQDKAIASRLQGAGLAVDLDSPEAAAMRWNMNIQNAMDASKEFAGGLLRDLLNGRDAVEALSDAFGRLADRLIDMALDGLIENIFGSIFKGSAPSTGGGGGIDLGGLISGGLSLLSGSSGSAGAVSPGMATGSWTTAIASASSGVASVSSNLAAAAKAIQGLESGGNYSAMGPMVNGDRAYGAYQVMGNNLPSWTQGALGQQLTPAQFLANPAAQDAVFAKYFGGNMEKFGFKDAASIWHSGRPLDKAAAAGATDGYMKTVDYVNKANTQFEKLAGTTAQLDSTAGKAVQGLGTMSSGFDAFGRQLASAAFPAAPGGGGGGFLSALFGGGGLPSFDFMNAISPAATSVILGGGAGLFARGGAFWRGSEIPFGRGDVFGSPTGFGMSGGRRGVMGENGPEAILPLRRGSDGRLGVAAAGGGAGAAPQERGRELHVHIDGANGDAHVIQLVRQGVSMGLREYDETFADKAIAAVANGRERGYGGV